MNEYETVISAKIHAGNFDPGDPGNFYPGKNGQIPPLIYR